MTTTERYDVEADLLAGVRRLVGPDVPVITSFDLHAAVSETTVGVVDAIVGFKTCPHVDYVETGQRAMTLAVRSARREIRPRVLRVAVPMLTASEAHDTSSGPLAPHMRRLQQIVADGVLLDGSIFACQPWLDTPRSTWTVTITSDAGDESTAASVADRTATALLDDLDAFRTSKVATGELWGAIDALLEEHRPVLVSDSGDSPSAGALGDSIDCLRELVSTDRPRVLATVTDQAAALAAHEAGCGSTVRPEVGGSLTPGLGESLAIEGEVISLHDGRFVQTYPASPVDAGPCAVVRVANTDLVVTSRPVIMLDTSVFAHVGTAPADYAVVQVKSAGGFRALWSTVSTWAVVADSLGASTSRLTELPFTHLPAPLWPFAQPSRSGVPA
jgi:microcystin degradation protein MlrC